MIAMEAKGVVSLQTYLRGALIELASALGVDISVQANARLQHRQPKYDMI